MRGERGRRRPEAIDEAMPCDARLPAVMMMGQKIIEKSQTMTPTAGADGHCRIE